MVGAFMILVRHSTPEKLRNVPANEWHLSEEGRSRCHELAKQLEGLQPDAIFSSPEAKAAETASILAHDLGLRVREISELAEHDRAGVPFFPSQSDFEQQLRLFFQQPDQRVLGRESAVEALARFEFGIARVHAEKPAQPLIVAHGTVLSLYIAKRVQLDAWTVWTQLETPCYVLCPNSTGARWRRTAVKRIVS